MGILWTHTSSQTSGRPGQLSKGPTKQTSGECSARRRWCLGTSAQLWADLIPCVGTVPRWVDGVKSADGVSWHPGALAAEEDLGQGDGGRSGMWIHGRLQGPTQELLIVSFLIASFPGDSDGKESACNAGDSSLILGSGRSLGEGSGNSLQYSCLGNPIDRWSWWVIVHRVPKSQTRLSD